jgi:hypothetical protein
LIATFAYILWQIRGQFVLLLRTSLLVLEILKGKAVLDADGVAFIVAGLLEVGLQERLLQGVQNPWVHIWLLLLAAVPVLLIVSGDVIYRL